MDVHFLNIFYHCQFVVVQIIIIIIIIIRIIIIVITLFILGCTLESLQHRAVKLIFPSSGLDAKELNAASWA